MTTTVVDVYIFVYFYNRIWKSGSDGSEIVDIKNMRMLKKPKSATDKEQENKAVDKKKLKSEYFKDGGMERLVSLNWVNGTVGRQVRKCGVKYWQTTVMF